MKSFKSGMKQTGKRGLYPSFHNGRRVLLMLAVILCGVVVSMSIISCNEDVPRVDMEDVVKDEGASPVNDRRPAIRVAVAAMISPETTRDFYKDLIRLIANRMGRRAVFLQRRTYGEVNAMVAEKEVDVAFVCSGPYVQGHDEFGMEILAVPVAHGQDVYHSYIIVHRDSPFETFDDLKGKRFAFTDPHSNTGCLVPTYMLARQEETPKSFFKDTFFSGSHDNSIRAVAEGQADGAAVDSLIWEFMKNIDPSLTDRTRIIEKSPPYGIPPVVVHPELNPELKKRLKAIFLSFHDDREVKALLDRLQIDRFGEGKDTMYDTVREMRRWIKEKREESP